MTAEHDFAEDELLQTLAKEGFHPDRVQREIEQYVAEGILNKPFMVTPKIPHKWENGAIGLDYDLGFYDGLPTVYVDSTEGNLVKVHFMTTGEYNGSLAGFGWEPIYKTGAIRNTRYAYPQMFFVPLTPHEYRDPEEIEEGGGGPGLSGQIFVGPEPESAKIYLPKTPWPIERLSGEVVNDALRESLTRARSSEAAENWRIFYGENRNVLPQETSDLIADLLRQEHI